MRFKLEDHGLLSFEADSIRFEAASRFEPLCLPKKLSNVNAIKLERIIAHMKQNIQLMHKEVRIMKREYDLVAVYDQFETADECHVRHYMKRRYLTSCEFHAQLWEKYHEYKQRLEFLTSASYVAVECKDEDVA